MGGSLGVLVVPLAMVVAFGLVFALLQRRRPRQIAVKGALAFVMGALPAAGITAMLLGEHLAAYWFALPPAALAGGLLLAWPVIRKPL